MAAFNNSTSKLWPSQRANFLRGAGGVAGYGFDESQTTLMGSPPMGMSASRLQSRLEHIRLRSNRRLADTTPPAATVAPSRSRPGTTTKLDRSMIKDSRLRQAPSAWSNKQVRLAFHSQAALLDEDDMNVSDGTTSASRAPSVHAVPTLRSSFTKTAAKSLAPRARARAPLVRAPPTLTLDDTVDASDQFGKMTEEEREMVTRLCSLALNKRKRALDYYAELNNRLKDESQTRIKGYDPAANNVRLCDLMLQLVTEREAMLSEQRGRPSNQTSGTANGTLWTSQPNNAKAPDPDLPVYCLDGITVLGRVSDTGLFRNTFAPLSSLKKPEDDPPGFERYVAIVDMSGFQDDEILIHASGNHLRLDGCGYSQSEEEGIRQRRVTENIRLPNGVYPDRLKIGRSGDGVLVIQEPWRF